MTRILRSVFSNLKYTFRSARFLAAVAGYLALLVFATADFYNKNSAVWYLLRCAKSFGSFFFCLVICALPGAAIFAEEWLSGRFIFSYLRAGKKEYAVSIILNSFLSAFFTAFVGTTLYIIIYSFINLITSDHDNIFFVQQMGVYANGKLLYDGKIFAYYFLDVLNTSCFMGLFSALAAMLSAIFTNPYITTVMPLLLYEVIINVLNKFSAPMLSNPAYVFSSGVTVIEKLHPARDITAENNFSVISMLYPLAFTAVCLAVIMIISYFLIKRKYEKNSDKG